MTQGKEAMTIDTQKLRHFAQWIERRYPEGTAKGVVEAADHIDAQAEEIARLRSERDEFFFALQEISHPEGVRGDATKIARAALQSQDREDAERWRYMRRKLCLTGNGNGTCAMQAINLPEAIPGWPEPGKVADFCDAAIDHARRVDGDGDA